MTETTNLTPALSAEEWATGEATRLATTVEWTAANSIIVRQNNQAVFVLSGELPSLIALANHALPDEHPGKFTHEHVEKLQTIAALIPMQQTGGGYISHSAATFLREFADRLAALLPPR